MNNETKSVLADIAKYRDRLKTEYQCLGCSDWHLDRDDAVYCCSPNERTRCCVCKKVVYDGDDHRHKDFGLTRFVAEHGSCEGIVIKSLTLDGKQWQGVFTGVAMLIAEDLGLEKLVSEKMSPLPELESPAKNRITVLWMLAKPDDASKGTVAELKQWIDANAEADGSKTFAEERFTITLGDGTFPLFKDQLPLMLESVSDDEPIEWQAVTDGKFDMLWIKGKTWIYGQTGIKKKKEQ